MKANGSKPIHVTFTARREMCPLVPFKQSALPQQEDVKYLGLHLDRRLTWHKQIFAKEKQNSLQATNLSYLKQYSNQSGLTEYNSGVWPPLPT
jgi:hypothetical protein